MRGVGDEGDGIGCDDYEDNEEFYVNEDGNKVMK